MNKFITTLTPFDENGLTSTSANHIANIAKELMQELTISLNKISFIGEKIELLDSDKPAKIISTHISKVNFDKINKNIELIGKFNGLIAWIREAISIKNSAINKIDEYTFDQYCDDNNIILEHYKLLPVTQPTTFSKEFDLLSNSDKARYYHNEAMCATFGKLIHQNTPISDARVKYSNFVTNPSRVNHDGKNTIITTYFSDFSSEEIESLFFQLQKQHRHYQAMLNKQKFDIEQVVLLKNTELANQYDDEVLQINIQNKEISNEARIFNIKFKEYCSDVKNKVSNLKISIPDNFNEVYNIIKEKIK